MSPRQFVEAVLVDSLHVVEVHEGSDFRFGRRAIGDMDEFARLGQQFGFMVVRHELVYYGGRRVSSTRIRQLIRDGDSHGAGELLLR